MSLRPRRPLGDNGSAATAQPGPVIPRLAGGALQAKRFGATPRKALGDLGNLGSGGVTTNVKKAPGLLVVGDTSVRKERERTDPVRYKAASRRSQALANELSGGLEEWDAESGEDDNEVEFMHLSAHIDYNEQSPWPVGGGPADGCEDILRPWPIDLSDPSGKRIRPLPLEKDASRRPGSDLDHILEENLGDSVGDHVEDGQIGLDLVVDIPLDLTM